MFENLSIGKPYLVETREGQKVGFLAHIGTTLFFNRRYIRLCQNESLDDSLNGWVITESKIKDIRELKAVGSK